jgi:hypothetical protein
MKFTRIVSVGLSLIIFLTVVTSSSCKSRKSACVSNGPYKTKKMKKNKSGYGSKYSYKAKPTRKPYVIKNKTKISSSFR